MGIKMERHKRDLHDYKLLGQALAQIDCGTECIWHAAKKLRMLNKTFNWINYYTALKGFKNSLEAIRELIRQDFINSEIVEGEK